MRRLLIGSAVLVLLGGSVFVAARSNRGGAVLVRSYVRFERAWARWLPLQNAKGLIRRLDPLMTTIGVLRPVRIEVERGVSLLLDPNDDVGRTILVSRSSAWEPEVWGAISSGLSEGSVFVDVGAYIGYDTLRASVRVGRSGKVVAFEPNPAALGVLRANIDASRATNVIVQPIACTEKAQTLTLFDSSLGGNAGSSSLSQANAGSLTLSYTVDGRPIDDVVRELGLARVDVVKADVEGAELQVVRGAAETLRRFHPRLILEVVPRQLTNMGATIEELEAFVESLGYTSVTVVDYKNKMWTVR